MGEIKRWKIVVMIGIMVFSVGVIGCSKKEEAKQGKLLTSPEKEISVNVEDIGNVHDINASSYAIKSMSLDGEEKAAVTAQTSFVAQKNKITPKDIKRNKPSTRLPELKITVTPKDEESAEFYDFYYMDNKDRLNVFFWERNFAPYDYSSVHLYQEQNDGSMEYKEIIWDQASAKEMNLDCTREQEISIMAQWIDEKTGDFYFIASKWGFEGKNYPSYVYGIHPNGKLFVNSQVEPHLIMDKFDSKIFATGYTINYIGQKNGIAYFSYYDNSQNAVLCYSMKQHEFTKQIFTENDVLGIINNQIVSIDDNCMQVSSIPEGYKEKLANGNSILKGKSIISQSYRLPKCRSINLNGEYVYLLTDTQYQRVHLGDDSWEMLADISQITKQETEDLSLCGVIPKDNDEFSFLWYEDCGAGFYIEKYQVK